MSDDQHPIKFIHLTRPIPGLEEDFQRARERYVLDAAEQVLGTAGRMISGSKTDYRNAFPDHYAVFNANVCTEPAGKVWFGDIDLTLEEAKLLTLARLLNQKVFLLFEHDGRFQGRDEQPALGAAVYTVTPEGLSEHGSWLRRGEDGRLHPA